MSYAKISLKIVLAALLFAAAPSILFGQGAPMTNSLPRQEEVRKLIATLQSADATQHDKVVACHRLAVIGTKEAVPALAALLTDEKLAHMARHALEPMTDPAAGAALRDALGKVQGKLLVGVINSIGFRRDAKATAALAGLLSNSNVEVAAAAAAALGRIGTAEAAKKLQSALSGASGALKIAFADANLTCAEMLVAHRQRSQAAAIYDSLCGSGFPDYIRTAAMCGAITARQTGGTSLLVEQLRSQDEALSAAAWRAARELRGATVTKALAAELGKLPAEKQVLLIQVLGDRGDKAALPAVVDAAKNGAPAVRVAAIRTFPRIGDASLVPFLLDTAAQADTEVAKAAQLCLVALPGKKAEAALVSAVSKGSSKVRRAAIEAVGQRGLTAAVPQLLKASADSDAAIRSASIEALGETVEVADFGRLADLLVQARNADEMSAAETALTAACGRITDKAACADKLLARLPQASPAAKCVLLELLAQNGGEKALQAIRTAAKDPNAQVKDAAIRALAEWPDLAAAPDLLQIVRTTGNASHRSLAFSGLVRLGREAEAPVAERQKVLAQALDCVRSDDDKKLVLSGLAQVPTLESLRVATGLLASTPGLADEAGAAVVKIVTGLDAKNKAEAVSALEQVINTAKAATVVDDARKQLRALNDPAAKAPAGKAATGKGKKKKR